MQHTRMSAQGPTCITCLHSGPVEPDGDEDDPYSYGETAAGRGTKSTEKAR